MGGDPINFVDPTGAYTEVITWEPVGSSESSFGHVSVVLNGRSFSFGPRGMNIASADSYIARQLRFRSGRGLILALSPLEEAFLEIELEVWSDPYHAWSDNCTDPLEHGLRDLGLRDARMNSLLPTGLARGLDSLAIGQTFYEGPSRAGRFIAPWSNAAYESFWSMY